MESGRLAAAWAYEARSRDEYSAPVLKGYERQLWHKRAREHLSGHAFVNVVPNGQFLEPFFKVCEKDPHARRTLIEGFSGDAPIYSLLKHPRALASALKNGLKDTLLKEEGALRS